jgi:DNA-directed RNA polymerase sigma subunit (sigma70/sigma32)
MVRGGTATLGNMSRGKSPRKRSERDRRRDADDPVSKLSGPLKNVLQRLPETQRQVLELRMGLRDGHPHDLADTARALGLSMGEARDIERRAFEHIREVVPLGQLQRLLDR